MRGDLQEVRDALARNPECINETDERTGVTALHIAAADGNLSLVELLCNQKGINFQPVDFFGRRPSQLAVFIGRDDIYKIISADMDRRLERRAKLDDLLDMQRRPKPFTP